MFIVKISRFIEKLATKNRLVMNIISLYYRSLVKKEVKLAGLTKDDNILCIGGGRCPFTAILIQKYTGAKVTVVDNCESCVASTKKCILSHNLKNIEVGVADGKNISAKGYTAIHLALQVCPMQEVLENIIEKSEKRAKILVRRPKKGLRTMYSEIKQQGVFLKARVTEVRHSPFVNAGYTSLYHKGL